MEWKEKGREARFLNVIWKGKQREGERGLGAALRVPWTLGLDPASWWEGGSYVVGAQTSSWAPCSGHLLLNPKLWLCSVIPSRMRIQPCQQDEALSLLNGSKVSYTTISGAQRC